MYRIVPDPAAISQVAALPDEALDADLPGGAVRELDVADVSGPSNVGGV